MNLRDCAENNKNCNNLQALDGHESAQIGNQNKLKNIKTACSYTFC